MGGLRLSIMFFLPHTDRQVFRFLFILCAIKIQAGGANNMFIVAVLECSLFAQLNVKVNQIYRIEKYEETMNSNLEFRSIEHL